MYESVSSLESLDLLNSDMLKASASAATMDDSYAQLGIMPLNSSKYDTFIYLYSKGLSIKNLAINNNSSVMLLLILYEH